MNKALLKFTPLEHAYSQKFGMMPDRHYEKLLGEKCEMYDKNQGCCKECYEYGCSILKEVGDTINANMKKVWEEEREFRNNFHIASSTPFKGV